MKKTIKYIITFISLIIGYNFLLMITSSFPSYIIEKNVIESADTLCKEGCLYEMIPSGDLNDNYTDAIMINAAYSIDNKEPVYSYFSGRKNYNKEFTKNQMNDVNGELISFCVAEKPVESGERVYDTVLELKQFLEGKVDTSVNYSRYWHGYLIWLRPLLVLLNVSQIRILLLLIFIILFFWLLYLIKKKIDLCAAIIYGVALILNGYFFVSYSLQGASVFVIMMLSNIILLMKKDIRKNFCLHLFIVGSLTCFFDYLTVPIITGCTSIYTYILCVEKNCGFEEKRSCLKMIFWSLFAWGIGYIATWASKWILYDLLYDGGTVKSAIAQILYRMCGDNPYDKTNQLKVLLYFFLKNLAYVFFLVGGLVLSKRIDVSSFNKMSINEASIGILAISFIPYAWFIFVLNHTTFHIHFSYRNLLICLIGNVIFIQRLFNKKQN